MEPTSTILVVDDDLTGCEILKELLADQGYWQVLFEGSPRALARAEELAPDLILLPTSENCLEVCRKLRSDPALAEIPVILAVDPNDPDARVRGLEAGADDFVRRPFDALEVQARVRALVRISRYYKEIRRHAAEMVALNRISQVITSILNLRETLGIIADQARLLLDVAVASVVLLDEESGHLWFGAASGESSDSVRGRRLDGGLGIVDWVIQEGEPLLIPDASMDPRFSDDWDKAPGLTIRSVLCFPLKAKGRTIGAIEAINKASGPFDQKDLTLLGSIAASAAIAIENARLYEQAQQEITERKRVVERLRRVNQALRTFGECHEAMVRAETESELLHDVCRILVEVGELCLAWIGFVEPDGGEGVRLVARAGRGAERLDMANSASAEWWRSPMDTAIRTGNLCLVRDFRTRANLASWSVEAIRLGYVSAVALPLVASDRTLGALTIYAGEPDAFGAEEVELLKELTTDLSFGIMALRTRAERDRAEDKIHHLYQELQDRAANLEETVTERTRELQLERDRTQAILEAVGEAVIVTDLRGKIQYLNPAAVALTGYTSEEVVGRSPRLWQPDQEVTGPHVQEERVPGESLTRRAEVVSRRKDGTLYDAAMTVAPLFDSQEAGRLIGHVCVQRDITPVREAERLKDRFVSNVSHELRTPLSVIALVSGNLDTLYDRLSDERRRKLIRDIRKHAQVLNDLIGDVLEISRVDGGRVSLERQEVNLLDLAREEADEQLPLAQERFQTLRVSGTEHLTVWGNADQLRQVIRNLLNNAIKYTPRHGQIACECVELAGTASEADWPGSTALTAVRWAALRVVDTGVGIGPEELPHVFDRFYRVKSQGNVPGTGLGLSIARELIVAHGGHISAASNPGQGSVFAIYLPLLEG